MDVPESQIARWSHEAGAQDFQWSPTLANELKDILSKQYLQSVNTTYKGPASKSLFTSGRGWRNAVGMKYSNPQKIKELTDKNRHRTKELLRLFNEVKVKEANLKALGKEASSPAAEGAWDSLTKDYRMVLVHAFNIKMNLLNITVLENKDPAAVANAQSERNRLQKIWADEMMRPEARLNNSHIPAEMDTIRIPEEYQGGKRKTRRVRRARKLRKVTRKH
jgi:hypothetical protein